MQYLYAISTTTEQSLVFKDKPFNVTVIQASAPTSNAEEAEVERFYEDLQDLESGTNLCTSSVRALLALIN